MNHEEYIQTVEDNLRASYFYSVPSDGVLGIDIKKRFLGIPYGEDPTARAMKDEFSAFYGERQGSGWFSSDFREVVLIYERPVYMESHDPVGFIRTIVDMVTEADWIQAEEGKFFIQVLFAGSGATEPVQRVIKNGATVNYPELAFLPVLADLEQGRLTYQTEQLDSHGLIGRPFIEQITEFANEYFQVSRT